MYIMHIYLYIYIYIHLYSEVMKTIQCTHPPHHHNGFVATCPLWTDSGVTEGQMRRMGLLDCLHDFTI